MKALLKLLTALLALSLFAAACGSDSSDEAAAPAEDSSAEEAAEPAGEALSMAIVAPSASDDLAFTQSMVDAIHALDREVDLQVTDGTFIVEEAAAAIRGYAEDGVSVIVVHGTQFGGSLAEIAPDFPDTTFLWGTATDTQGLANVFAYYPAADQGGYVNGVMAAALSEAKSIGVVGPVEAGDAVAYINGFAAGAEAGGAEVSIVYTGSFGDVQLAQETAEGHVSNGADVMTGSAQMVAGAVAVAAQNDIAWFGTQANQNDFGPSVVVASQVYHWEIVLEQMLALYDEGTLGGTAYEINLENGGLIIEFNDAYGLSDEIKTLGEETIAGIIDGSISTGQ